MIMKKRRILLVSLFLTLLAPLTIFGKIEHGYSKGSYELQKDGTYKLYRTYYKEDGNTARNEWIQVSDDRNAVGVSYFEYYDNDGNILSNTTTPDEYLVNYEGRWYTHCPGAVITEAEGSRIEKYGSVFFPFSYDGNVVQNDYLGITLNYNGTDYQEGIKLNMRNYTCASSYSAFWITLPDGTEAHIDTFPADKSADAYINSWVESEDTEENSTVVYYEKTIGGKPLRGYKIISTYADASGGNNATTYVTCRLFRAISGGASWGIEYKLKNTEADALLINWLNTHMTLTK
jgi:hypothetical protein